MNLRRFRALSMVISFSLVVTAAKSQIGGGHDYDKVFMTLYQAVQGEFYDSASGYYRDHEEPAPKVGYAYCWPLCGLFQAYNEAEAAGIARPSFLALTA